MYGVLGKEGYENLYLEEQKEKLKVVLNFLKDKKYYSILDVGAGTGWAKEYFPEKFYVALDPEEKFFENSKPIFVLGKAENIPFQNNKFDVVISLTALHHVKDVDKALKECKRVGKQIFVFSILKRSSKFKEIEEKIYKYFQNVKVVDSKKDKIYLIEEKVNSS